MIPGELQQAGPAVELIDAIRAAPERRGELVDLLAEQSPIYHGMGTAQAERLRGYVLASFATVGLPDEALPFIAEQLQTGFEPYTVAAAARALPHAASVPDAIVGSLRDALGRIQCNDKYVQYETYSDTGTGTLHRTALEEVLLAIAELGPRAAHLRPHLESMAGNPAALSAEVAAALRQALVRISAAPGGSCCCGSEAPALHSGDASRSIAALADLALQDQSGTTLTFGEFFLGRPSVLAFFYTRCMNPQKCSLTIERLARLQRMLRDEGMSDRVAVAAMTYDREFDVPERLHAYGVARGMIYDDRNRLLRTAGPLEPLERLLDLGVGFGPATVNQHRTEVFVLDQSATVRTVYARVQWREQDVLATLKELVTGATGVDPSP